MQLFRKIRARILKRTSRKPTTFTRKVEKGFETIKATESEKILLKGMITRALERRIQKEAIGNNGSLRQDAQIISLNKEAHDLLGNARAKKFFEICNDPYA